jgi:hypothetical protein
VAPSRLAPTLHLKREMKRRGGQKKKQDGSDLGRRSGLGSPQGSLPGRLPAQKGTSFAHHVTGQRRPSPGRLHPGRQETAHSSVSTMQNPTQPMSSLFSHCTLVRMDLAICGVLGPLPANHADSLGPGRYSYSRCCPILRSVCTAQCLPGRPLGRYLLYSIAPSPGRPMLQAWSEAGWLAGWLAEGEAGASLGTFPQSRPVQQAWKERPTGLRHQPSSIRRHRLRPRPRPPSPPARGEDAAWLSCLSSIAHLRGRHMHCTHASSSIRGH